MATEGNVGEIFHERILAPEATDQWLWIVIVGAFGAFFAAFGIGANDVANAFATSVGAKAITLRQAILFAAIFEFLGAVLLGSHVTETIRSGIAEVHCFTDNPGILMYGMMCVVYTTGLWLLLASALELPVSTTHSTVGGIVGMAMAYRGSDCVLWYEETETFPFLKGISAIVVSWVLSPLFSGLLSVTLFVIVRQFVLRSENAYERSFWVYPVLVMATVSVNVFFIVYKGAKGLNLDDTKIEVAFAYAFGLGGGIGLITIPTMIPYMRSKVGREFNEDGTRKVKEEPVTVPKADGQGGTGIVGYINRQLDQDLHASVKDSEYVSAIHDATETFDPRAEEVFKYVQVVTAICDSFGHGANDVANAMGPFAAIYSVYVDGEVDDKADLGSEGYWILGLGGLGIVLGLALYGYKIISAIGVKIAKITPSRGFTIELGAAMMIIIGTRLEIPLSTTHCQVGSTAAVALLEGSGGLNSVVLLKAIVGWIITILICALTCALIFAQGAYAPYVFDTV